MKKLLLTLLTLLCMTGTAQAWNELRAYNATTGEKGIYLPSVFNQSGTEYQEGAFSWSMSRKRESTNFVVFWDKGYGSTAPDQLATSNFYYVDINNLLAKAEEYYALYATTMGFVNPTTSTTMSKYKCMIMLEYSTEWAAYGSGYDFVVPALWINPETCKPVGHTIAHEVGHSFHYMAFAEANNHQNSNTINTGFHLACGQGQAIWEQTAQFQAAMAEPTEMFTESYPLFCNNANYAFSHEWMRYQSYWFHYYLCQYYNDPAMVGKVWNQPMTGQSEGNATDFCQAYIKLKNLTAAQFYERYFDYALRCATYDFDAAASYRNNYIGKFDYHCSKLSDKKYQVAYHSAPQSTGFNVIELNVPSSGTTITTQFTALTHGCALDAKDPATYNNGVANANVTAGVTKYNSAGSASYRGFRVGYVFLNSNGTRTYYNDGIVHCTGTAEKTENISTTVPANTSRIFLVVTPALTTYVKHAWDENISNDDQWPYSFELVNTDLKTKNETVIYTEDIPVEPAFTKEIDGRSIADVTLTYNVILPPDASGYTGATVSLNSGSAVNALCTAFQLESNNIFGHVIDYTGSQSNNTIMSCALTAAGGIQTKAKNTNGTFGHWFNSSGTVVDWGNSTVIYTQLDDQYDTNLIGQMPGANSNGTTRTVREGLVYKNSNGKTAKAIFVYNITFKTGAAPTAYLSEIDYTKPTVEPISETSSTIKPTKTTLIQEYSFTIEQGQQSEYALTAANISSLKTALNSSSSTFETSILKSSTRFLDYIRPTSSMNEGSIYYYALSTAPTTSSFKYYATASNTNDSDFGSGTFTHYYLSASEVIAATDASQAYFKIAYDRANAKFIVKVTDNCPAGTYNNVRFGMMSRIVNSGNKYYVGYFTFNITVTKPAVNEETLNVERYVGLGYTVTEASVDFTNAKEYLGVNEVTTDMLRIINPDNSVISDYATYDGWFNGEGTAEAWGSNTKINVKFFQAIPNGTYTICDMNGADVVGTTYTVKWALTANDKTYTYYINVTFVDRPTPELYLDDLHLVGDEKVVNLTSSLGSFYEGFTADAPLSEIFSALGVSTINDVTVYAVQSDGSLDDNYRIGTTDGWRNADGDWQTWGDNAYFYVKADFTLSNAQLYEIGGMEGKNTTEPATYTATYAFVKNGSSTNDAVILKVNLIYPEAEVLDIILADTETSYEVHTGNHNVTLERSLPAGKWLSFCAPFNIYGEEFEGMGISRAMSLESVTKNGGTITLNFADIDNIMVGVPVIIKMSETKTGITKNNTGYGSYEATPTTTVENGTLTAKMIGTYVKIDLPDDVYYLQDDKFRHTTYIGTTATAMKGWRAYFTITDSANEVKAVRYNLDGEDVEPTDIEGIVISTNDNIQSTIFDLSGRRVQHPVKGFYIVNGKKMFVK